MREQLLTIALCTVLATAPLAGCAQQKAADTNADTQESEQQAQVADDQDTDTALEADTEYVLYLGTNDKDTNEPVFTREESMQRAKDILIKNFGGYTIQEAEGGWIDDDGTEYQEYTLVIHLYDTDEDTVHAVCREFIDEFHQSSVLISRSTLSREFYSGE
jgi:hypothetical protein